MAFRRGLARLPAAAGPRRRVKTVGLPPGTLVYTGAAPDQPTRISLTRYDADNVEEREVTVEDLADAVRPGSTAWVNVEGVADTAVIERIGQTFGIDALALEDVVRVGQRPKLEIYEHYLYIVLRMFVYEADLDRVRHEQISLILAPDLVITFQERPGDIFDPIRRRIRDGQGRVRTWGADYLAYALLDVVVDNYFVVLEHLGERVDNIEDVVVEAEGPDVVAAIHRLKREHLFLRKATWPLRELVGNLVRGDSGLFSPRLAPYLRDVYDHTVEIVDTIETLRDMLNGMLDIYLSSVSNRMNSVMKVLTIITTIFVPLTFIAGVYGMNFHYMPELAVRWAYPAVLGLMATLLLGMLAIFHWKGWL